MGTCTKLHVIWLCGSGRGNSHLYFLLFSGETANSGVGVVVVCSGPCVDYLHA